MSSAATPAWNPPALDELPAALPGFVFTALIGRGGMGAVYKAMQTSLGRTVAVKVLPAALMERADAGFAARFEREARVMAGLSHPGIVSVLGFGRTDGGLLYMVMEYVDGPDLAQWLRERECLTAEEAAGIITQVCEALDAAHRAGVIHRDIKPANILLARDGTVKLADFGLARQQDAAAHGLTQPGATLGTPEFIAPEAWTPGALLDARADIYALGVVLYQMLTGALPHGRWQLPGAKAGRDARFDAVIRKAMQPDRSARYQSTAELRRDLHISLATGPRRRNAPWIIAAAALVIAAAAMGHWWPRHEAAAPRGEAPLSTHVTHNSGSGPGSLLQAFLNAERTPGPDTITFDPSLSGQTIVLGARIAPFDNDPAASGISAVFLVDASSLPGGLTIAAPPGLNAFVFKEKSCDVSFRGLTFTGGAAAYGAFLLNDGTVTLTDCRITGNHVSANGGALGNNGTMRLLRCTVSRNTAGAKAGAINTLGTFTAEDCTFTNNSAALGGAVSVGGGTAEFTRCTFFGNEASRQGGAVGIFGAVKATHCTFAGNQVTGTTPDTHGGGAFILMDAASTLALEACIVAGNTAATGLGPDIWTQQGKVSAVRSLIGVADGTGVTAGTHGNLTGTAVAPLDAKLSPLGDYGGPTQTMPPLPGSLAIDAAKGSTATVDQRGQPVSGIPNMGAAE